MEFVNCERKSYTCPQEKQAIVTLVARFFCE